jgi:hypothetical protein
MMGYRSERAGAMRGSLAAPVPGQHSRSQADRCGALIEREQVEETSEGCDMPTKTDGGGRAVGNCEMAAVI